MSTQSKPDYTSLEAGLSSTATKGKCTGRIVQDFSGPTWKMEKMRVGQGMKEGLHLLTNEHSGNDFSWNYAKIPGDVYTDLYLAGEIDDPHFGRNMAKIKWVQEYEWWYGHCFNVPEEMEGKRLALLFEGVDYSCDVWLNTVYLGHHEGMFSAFRFDVTDVVSYAQPKAPANLLTIKLDPPPRNQKNIAGLKHNFSGDYLTGLVPFGIWRPIKLIATDALKIDHYRAEYKISDDHQKAIAELEVELSGDCVKNAVLKAEFRNPKDGSCTSAAVHFDTQAETSCQHITVEIDQPHLWYPYELGDPFLYDLTLSITKDDALLDSITEKAGIRTITMKMNPGFTPEECKNPWTFVINGKEMFLRSACWGGQPSFFYGRNSIEKYQHFLQEAKNANINNLRIFGWHPPETKEFYDLCDEYGITVWTNFTFATQEFRDDKEYLDAVAHEIEMTVKARRNHPSIIMWIGGEEVYFSESHVYSNNKNLMEQIGQITNSFTDTPYGEASPMSATFGIRVGNAPKESFHANAHYYAAGAIFMEDFYPTLDYAIIPELTAASSPNVESLQKFIPPQELWPMGPSFGYHMADIHVLQNLNYEVFGDIKMGSLEEFVEATQIAQGTVAQFALEHFRRQKPHVSGVSLCHFITNWPIIKWDIIDYYGVKKRSFDYVKRAYNPILPSLAFAKRRWLAGETFTGELYALNDYYKAFKDVVYNCTILDKNRQPVYTKQCMIEIGENSAAKCDTVTFVLPEQMDDCFYIVLTFTQNDILLIENEYKLLVADQEQAKKEAYQRYLKMHEARQEYGTGYYRYNPELFADL